MTRCAQYLKQVTLWQWPTITGDKTKEACNRLVEVTHTHAMLQHEHKAHTDKGFKGRHLPWECHQAGRTSSL